MLSSQSSQHRSVNQGLRILVVARARKIGGDGYKHRVCSIVQELVAQGHYVTLLCFFPILELFRQRNGFPPSGGSLRILLVPALPFTSLRWLGPLSRLLSGWVVRGVQYLYRFEAVQCEEPLCATLASRAGISYFVTDFHGDGQAEQEMRQAPRWRVRLCELDEEAAVNRSDAILAASERLRLVMLGRHASEHTLSATAPCGVDLDRFGRAAEFRRKSRAQLGLNERIVVCYLGGLSRWQCIEETISWVAAFRRLEERVFFLLLTTQDTSGLKEHLGGIGRSGEDFCSLSLSPTQVPEILPAADLGMLLREDSPVNAVASPTKCGEYLAAGVPVLTTTFAGDSPQVLALGESGLIVPSVNPTTTGLDGAISFLRSVMADRDEWFGRCRDTAARYQSWSVAQDAIRAVYRDVKKFAA
jgi:glycosyltransferase involved in cell wall biosynthesis